MGLFSGIFGGGEKAPKLKFKPTTITTGAGTGTYNPKTGAVSTQLSPELQQLQGYFLNQALGMQGADTSFGQGISDFGQGMFNQAANLDTNQLAQQYYSQQQNLLAPDRTAEEARLAETLFRTGRTGAAAGVEGGYVNPEQFALLKAREQQNAQLGLNAENMALERQRQQLQQGLGLYGAGQEAMMSPYAKMNTLLGYGGNVMGIGNTLTSQLGTFGGLTNNMQQAKYNADLNAYNASQQPGLFGSLLGAGVAAFGAQTGTGLGNWAGSLFSQPQTNPAYASYPTYSG